MTEEPQRTRRLLVASEVPLPQGYPRSILDEQAKERLRAAHHARVEEIVDERLWLDEKCADDPVYREKVLLTCEEDPAWWMDHFLWTYDDRLRTEEPLVLYPFQVEKFVEPYKEMRTVTGRHRWTRVGNKTRGVGATVTALGLRLHSFSFMENWSVLLGSAFQDDVDDGGQTATHQCLFGKLRYMIGKLPRWMRERLYGPLIAREEYNKRFLLQNPRRPRNHIAGEQFSSMFSRSQRFREVLGDEIAWSDSMESADRALKQTTNCFEGFSTPQGKHTFHYQLFSGALPGVQTYTCHWSEHPDLDVAWYNEQREHMTDETIASELDCSFEGSAGGRVLKEVTLDTHFTLRETRTKEGMLVGAYESGLPLHVIIDPGIADDLAVTWGQWDEGRKEGRVVDFVQTKDRTIDWVVPFILGRVPSGTHRGLDWPHDYGPIEEEIIDRHRLWRAPETVFGDAYGKARSGIEGGKSLWDELAQYGIFVHSVRVEDDLAAIARCVLLMRYIRFAHRLIEQRNGPRETCPTMGEVVTQWRYPKRRADDFRPVTGPVHDRFCHGGDTLKMWGLMLDLPEATSQPVESGRVIQARGSDVLGGRNRWPRSRR